jgi:Tfp pilus assembly protein PilO
MKRLLPRISGELALAIVLVVSAVGVDFAFVRPQENELQRLATRKKMAERSYMLALHEQAEWDAMRDYLHGDEEDGDWRHSYMTQDPLQLLEEIRKEARLRRFDVRLQERELQDPLLKTTYFMSVHGSFAQQLRFLKSLEQAAPLITVESFVMDKQDGDPAVTSKLNVAVLTLAAESAS